jgi:outer membrane protein assembly factor BamA
VSSSAETFGADHSFTKVFAQHSAARSFGRRGWIAAGSIRAGAGWSFDESDQLPLSERFFAGGVASVRGWQLDHLGPKDPVTGEPVGGDALLVLNSELRVPITRRTWFIGFVDAGNVFDSPSGFGSRRLELTFGPGIAISTPVGPIRFYYGHKADDPPDEPSGELHFTFGGTF